MSQVWEANWALECPLLHLVSSRGCRSYRLKILGFEVRVVRFGLQGFVPFRVVGDRAEMWSRTPPRRSIANGKSIHQS